MTFRSCSRRPFAFVRSRIAAWPNATAPLPREQGLLRVGRNWSAAPELEPHHAREPIPNWMHDRACLVRRSSVPLRVIVLGKGSVAHAAAGHGGGILLLRVRDHGFGGDQECRDGAGILKGSAHHLGRIYDAGFDHVDVSFSLSVEP